MYLCLLPNEGACVLGKQSSPQGRTRASIHTNDIVEGKMVSSRLIQRIATQVMNQHHQQGRGLPTSVYDALVSIQVIDSKGKCHALRGIEGQNVADLFQENVDVLGKHAVAASPEGRGKVEAHVKVPQELFGKIPGYSAEDDEKTYMEEVADPNSLDQHSRLGSRIVLDKSMEGMIVSVGDIYPWKTL